MNNKLILLTITGTIILTLWYNYYYKKKDDKYNLENQEINQIDNLEVNQNDEKEVNQFDDQEVNQNDTDYEDDDNVIESFSDESQDKFLDWKSLLSELNYRNDSNLIVCDSFISNINDNNKINIIDKRNHNNRFYLKKLN